MKRLIATTLISLMAPVAIAGQCILNGYSRSFSIDGDSSLPALRIMSVNPSPNQKNLSAATVRTANVLNISGYRYNACLPPVGIYATTDVKMPKDDVAVTVRVGYDDNHYVDVIIYVRDRIFHHLETSVLPITPMPHGITYVFKHIPQGGMGNVSLTFTKKGN